MGAYCCEASANSPASRAPGPSRAISLAFGGDHTCAAVGANVYCWGSNSGGQLGGGNVGGTSGVPVKVLLPPKATVAGAARSVKPNGSRKATVSAVKCPKGAGLCTAALPETVTVKLGGTSYKIAIAELVPVTPGTTGEIVATLSTKLFAKLAGGKSARIRVKVPVTDAGGKLVKTIAANVKR